jgi:hypothetical protein
LSKHAAVHFVGRLVEALLQRERRFGLVLTGDPSLMSNLRDVA